MRGTDHAVVFENPSAGLRLAGTLALPGSAGPHPAVILVHGQGPLDRDMSFGRLRPFRALAEHLAEHGIASLRYDKRGVGESDGEFGSATREDLVSDLVAALWFLQDQPGVRRERIGLVGQSEGGMLAPSVASATQEVAFVVMLAGPALPGRDNLAHSFALFAQASPTNERRVDEFKQQVERLLDLLGRGPGGAGERSAALRLAESLAPHVVNEHTRAVLGGGPVDARQFVGFLSSSCLQELVESVPEVYLSRLKCPVLALFAEHDKHVPAGPNAEAARRFLEAAGNRRFTVETMAGCNHLFQSCVTGYPDEYFTLDHDMSPQVLGRVSGWITGVVGSD